MYKCWLSSESSDTAFATDQTDTRLQEARTSRVDRCRMQKALWRMLMCVRQPNVWLSASVDVAIKTTGQYVNPCDVKTEQLQGKWQHCQGLMDDFQLT